MTIAVADVHAWISIHMLISYSSIMLVLLTPGSWQHQTQYRQESCPSFWESCMNAATRAVPVVPLFYRNLQTALSKALQEMGQDYSENMTEYEGGAAVVGGSPLPMKWQDSDDRETSSGYRIRCIKTRLGSNLPKSPDGKTLVQGRVPDAYQLPRGTGCLSSSQVFPQGEEERNSSTQDGQHECSHICEQTRRNNITEPDIHNQETLDVVHAERHNPSSRASTGGAELCGRRRVTGDERQDRLEAEPRSVQTHRLPDGSTGSGSVCITPNSTTPTLLQLETPYLEAEVQNAFSQDWSRLRGISYVNPPWNLVGRTLSQVRAQRATIVLIVPVWKAQAWYTPTLLGMLTAFPVRLPHSSDLMLSSDSNELTRG